VQSYFIYSIFAILAYLLTSDVIKNGLFCLFFLNDHDFSDIIEGIWLTLDFFPIKKTLGCWKCERWLIFFHCLFQILRSFGLGHKITRQPSN